MPHLIRRLPGLVLVILLAGCSLTRAGRAMEEIAPEINATLTRSAIVLAPGDVLSVRFTRIDGWSQDEVGIQADGRASFLSLGNIRVAGMTLSQLDQMLTEKYTQILAQPELTVVATQTAPRNITVMGEVEAPGSFEIPSGRLTLLEAIGLASGHIRDTAKLDHTLLVRWVPEENRMRAWKIDASLGQWDAEESILLQAHDLIFVPAKPVVKVNDWIDRYIRRNIPLPSFSGTF